ncbi:MAG TPA: hypothetical protein V6D23_17585, partial [Candidatus Obscuribacterales bacterium]
MKRISLLLSTLVLAGCAAQPFTARAPFAARPGLNAQRAPLRRAEQPLTAKTGLELAVKTVQQILPGAKMSDIDYSKTLDGEVLTYYFHKQVQPEHYQTIPVNIDIATGRASTEDWPLSEGQYSPDFDFATWQIDHPEAVAIARKHGLKGEQILGVLYQGAWSLADLDNH